MATINYRKGMTPGLKACKDYYEGNSSKKYSEDKKTDGKPPAYTMPKIKK